MGATGATGQLVVAPLLDREQHVVAVVRSPQHLPDSLTNHSNLTVIKASIADLTKEEIGEYVGDCSAVVSCLGHRMTFKGIFGKPRRLVTDATRRVCEAIQANGNSTATKFILMNTSGNHQRGVDHSVSLAERCVTGLLRIAVPPHADNEDAAHYLSSTIGQNDSFVEWSAVRPDGLITHPDVTDYELHHSPTRSAIFNAGKTSRINVAHFMARLVTDPELWKEWRGKMPVIYNQDS